MKHDHLRAIGHNVAASIADGCSLVTGFFDIDLLAALRDAPDGVITANLLRGTIEPQLSGSTLAEAIATVPSILPDLCSRHGVDPADFRVLRSTFRLTLDGVRFTVTVVDNRGRASETEYGGHDGQRTKTKDPSGRLRPRPVRRWRFGEA